MERERRCSVLGPHYEVGKREQEGRPSVVARTWDPESGFQIVLTFPESGGAEAHDRFRSRLARTLLGLGGS